jgi:hypothetical protein
VFLSSICSQRNTPFLRPFGDARFLLSAGKYYVISFFRGFELGSEFVPCTTRLLNVSSTTEPIRCHIGSVVELTFNKSVVPRVRTVGPASSACVFKLYLFPMQHSLPSPFRRCSLLAWHWKVLRHIVFQRIQAWVGICTLYHSSVKL